MFDFAEKYVIDLKLANLNDFVMWVLSVRHELIAYYERRGYVQTGRVDVFIPWMPMLEFHKSICI